MNNKTRIILAEDHQIMREALRTLLDSCEALAVVGEANTGREALEQAKETAPHVVVMDINMPDLNGIEATRQLTALYPQLKVIGLSVHEKGRMISEMLQAGAHGYIPKTSAAGELLEAIRTVMDGKMYVSPEVMTELVNTRFRSSGRNEEGAFSKLSNREREVLQLLAEGYSTKEVGDKLNLSVPTIHTHRQHLMQKLNARSVADLVRYAIREGITSADS